MPSLLLLLLLLGIILDFVVVRISYPHFQYGITIQLPRRLRWLLLMLWA
jgi:hypothetical protein